MAPPLPSVTAQGSGVVSSDQFNTYVQVAQNFAQLRTFTALNDMAVFCLGGVSEGDGLQGWFWYNSTSSAVDNGSTVIKPTGAGGAWLLLPPGSQSPGSFASLTISGNGTFGGNVSIGGTLSVTGVAIFDADVSLLGTGEIQIPAGTTAQRSGSPAVGDFRYNTTLSTFEGYGASGWQSLGGTGVSAPPSGRLTLTSGVPVLSSAVIGASGVIWTPFNGNGVPQWNGSTWILTAFAEISQALSDTTNSPAAAVAGGLYDYFVWFKSGAATLSRGPAWTNSTTRSLSLSRVAGFQTNSVQITNGPAAGYGLFVGSIVCDAGGATVTFNPAPAAASGGPTGGAWVGLWNQFNRVSVGASARDSNSSWSYTTASWRAADGQAANNIITFVTGQQEDMLAASYTVVGRANQSVPSNGVAIGIGVDSVTSAVAAATPAHADAASSAESSVTASYVSAPMLGRHYVAAVEYSNNSAGAFYGLEPTTGVQSMQISAQLRF